MEKISDMDWAMHIKVVYSQNLTKDPVNAKKRTLIKFLNDKACPFSKSGIYYFMERYDKTGSIKDGRKEKRGSKKKANAHIKTIHEEKARRQSNSPFTLEQEKFIVEKFTDFRSPTVVRRAFIKEYKKFESHRKLQKLHPTTFLNVFKRFQHNEIAANENYVKNERLTNSSENHEDSSKIENNECEINLLNFGVKHCFVKIRRLENLSVDIHKNDENRISKFNLKKLSISLSKFSPELCEKCDMYFYSKNALQNHIDSIHFIENVLNTKSLNFQKNSEHLSEMKEIAQQEICEICKKEFNSAKEMMTHTSLEHLAETIKFANNYILHPYNKENVKIKNN